MRRIADIASELLGEATDGVLVISGDTHQQLEAFMMRQSRQLVQLVFPIENSHTDSIRQRILGVGHHLGGV